MKFKSKTELIEHIKELVKNGYLIEDWRVGDGYGIKFYTINFEAVKK